ncbi:hypothetical protein ACKC5O_01765 [Aeromonas schubertii]|uniref:hypothetical protein n=1 Tax=Aeromonas schubertii TaxID=652 RepID=UPI0038B4E0E0
MNASFSLKVDHPRVSRGSPWPLLLLILLLFARAALAGTTFTYISPESDKDPRQTYDRDLLQLALEKSRPEYGPYELVAAPPMNRDRIRLSIRQNRYPNLFAMDSWSNRLDFEQMHYVPFPIHLGLTGYRICFVNPERAKAVAQIRNREEARLFLHGQGKGWLDVEILRQAGFKVLERSEYEKLFLMVARGRIDLFCRGVGELQQEWKSHAHLPGLTVDSHLLFYYPLPRVFFTHVSNREGLGRIRLGLERAWRDGSLEALWRQAFGPSIKAARLEQRLLIPLDNPYLKGIGFDYRRYFYNPATDRVGDVRSHHPPP